MDQLLTFLKEKLEEKFGPDFGDIPEYLNTVVYITPPAGKAMVYPCILINRGTGDTKFADNTPFRHQKRYELTAIDEESDSPLYDLLASLPRSIHNRSFPAENLNHDVFTLFF